MEHVLLKAVTTATDEGTFEAVISAATVDRERDIVDPAGMVRALQKWVPTGKQIPLAWNHGTAAEDIIGRIDPSSAKALNDEVVVSGWIDQSTPRGAEAWRLVKAGVLGFSFGYLTLDSEKRKDGGRLLKEIDVFEVTATPTPMNNDTRVLGWKSTQEPDEQPSDELTSTDLRARADATALEVLSGGESLKATKQTDEPPTAVQLRVLTSMIGQAQEFIGSDPDPEDAAEMADILETLEELRGEPDTEEDDQMMSDMGKGLIPRSERQGARAGELKAVWTAAYINNLPDSAFLHIEPGGSKDDEGKTTPRSLRHFPVKDDSGAVDMPHLRNAMSRIPQSNLPQSVKDSATAKAQRMMDAAKAVDVTGRSHRARSVDPLRIKADATALEVLSGGESLKKPPQPAIKASPQPEYSLPELKRQMREQMLTVLSGGTIT